MPTQMQWDEHRAKMGAEIQRLRSEVVALAQLGDFSNVRPNSAVLKQVVEIKKTGTYQQQRPQT